MSPDEPMYTDRELIAYATQELLECLDRVAPEERARCAESAACDLLSTMAQYHCDGWDTLYDVLSERPDPSVCGLLYAMSLATTGPRRIDLVRRAAAMRFDLPPQDWIDHIGTAVPTGRAARGERPDQLMWLVELNDGLHTYCLMTAQDLDRGILHWAGLYPSFADIASRKDEGTSDTDPEMIDVPLEDAIVGMSAAMELPGMFGVSTTVQMFGYFVRWHLWRLRSPSALDPPQVDWVDPPRRSRARGTGMS